MPDENLQLPYGKIPRVLLMGNGINRAHGFASWEGLIEMIRTRELTEQEKASLERVPYPLQPVILTGDHVDTMMKAVSTQLSELRVSPDAEELLRAFAALPFDAILTSNYTYELEKAMSDQFRCLPARRCKARKIVYSEANQYNTKQLHTCFTVGSYPPVWHIHGEAACHDSMILGHYYYGKLLAKLQQYVPSLIRRYHAGKSSREGIELRSWLDYFMLGDVYIVGLGMALSELDLWWLVNCKKRHFPDRKVYFYKPDIKPEEKLLAEAYGMIVVTDGYCGDYKAYYAWLCEKLKEKLA